ncbi:tetratricopeptide repeat protein, partial [Micromonospora chalcea]
EALLREVLVERERVLGFDHPDTLASRDSLAGVFRSAGRLDEAEALLREVLVERERVLGFDHPDTLASRDSLAGVYRSAGRPD